MFAVLLLFLRLRLVDELKDLEHDRAFHPDRPLPRGLVEPWQMGTAAAGVFLVEVLVAASAGVHSLGFFTLVSLYSVFTFREFFCRNWLRRHFAFYAVSHELLIIPVCFYLYSLSGLSVSDVPTPLFWGVTAYIGCLLFLLEVARKLSPSRAESGSNDTYTSQYGPGVSALVVCFLAAGTIAAGIITAAMLRDSFPTFQLAGIVFLVPVGASLRAFIKQADDRTARMVLNRCAVLAVVSSSLLVLTAWSI